MEIIYQPIGLIYSPFKSLEDMPIQPTNEASGPGTVEIFHQFIDGLKDLEGFSHIYLIYSFHKVQYPTLTIFQPFDMDPRGIFATRAPSRPNPIGLSLVKLIKLENNIIYVEQLDVLDRTPLLDIKPYIPGFENPQNVKIGWLKHILGVDQTHKSDEIFE